MAANKNSNVRLTTPSLSFRCAVALLGVAGLSLAAPAAADIPLPTDWVVPVSDDAAATAGSILDHAEENATALHESAVSLVTKANESLNLLDPTGPHSVYDPTNEVTDMTGVALDLPGGLAGEALAWQSRSQTSVDAQVEQTRVAAFSAAGAWTGLAGGTFVDMKAAVDGVALQVATAGLGTWNTGYDLADATADSSITLLADAILPAICQIVSVFGLEAADQGCDTATDTITSTVTNPLTNPLDPSPDA